jgi:hypothetical protein
MNRIFSVRGAAAIIGLVACSGAWAQVTSFPPPIISESQRRAQAGFPPLDERALALAYSIHSGRYDRRAGRYFWSLAQTVGAPPNFSADYLDNGGQVVASQPLSFVRMAGEEFEASVATPPPDQLSLIGNIVIRRDP